MGDGQGIHRQGQATHEDHRDEQPGDRAGVDHDHREQRGDRRQEGDDRHDAAPVVTVGQAPDRPLEDRAADDQDGHEDRDLGQAEPGALGEDRAHAEQHAVGQAGAHGADHAERRDPVELARPTGWAVENYGVAVAVSEIGTRASETRTEARMKSWKPPGAATLSSSCPPAWPDSRTTM